MMLRSGPVNGNIKTHAATIAVAKTVWIRTTESCTGTDYRVIPSSLFLFSSPVGEKLSLTCRLLYTPVLQALHLSIDAFTGTPPAADWKRPLGRPRRT